MGRWVKRLGVAGTALFLGKGVLWQLVPAVAIGLRACAGEVIGSG